MTIPIRDGQAEDELTDARLEAMTVYQLCREQESLTNALNRVRTMMQKRADENVAILRAQGRYYGPQGEY